MTRKRTIIAISVVAILTASTWIVVAKLGNQRSALRDSYERICKGMTRTQVDSLFQSGVSQDWKDEFSNAWATDREKVVIGFDGLPNRVVYKQLMIAIVDPTLPWHQRWWFLAFGRANDDHAWWQLEDCEHYEEK